MTDRPGGEDDTPRAEASPGASSSERRAGPSSSPPDDTAVNAAIEGRPDDTALPFDGHLHTVMSPDADVAIDTYAAAALARGIAEIAITDHVDFEPSAPAYALADFATRERYVRDAATRWADRGVTIRFGIEVTYQSRYEPEIREHLARHAYDHAIGSVHVMRDDPYVKGRVAAWVAGRTFDEIVAPYFAEVLAAARSGLFDTLGHLDFVKRYLAPHVPPAAFAAAPEVYEPILVALVGSGTGLEVNTSGLRQAAEETYPAPWAVARFRALGGARVTVGSDAHLARSFAFGLGRGYDVAADAGFRDVVLGGRRPLLSGGGADAGGRVLVARANPRSEHRQPADERPGADPTAPGRPGAGPGAAGRPSPRSSGG
jgi:histidinol-phosphatase (PHP family)